jgi:hypothetical protein
LELGRELDDDDLESINNNGLEVIIEFLHVGGNAAKNFLNITFVSSLQDGGDGESRDVAVAVSNQRVKVTNRTAQSLRMNGSDTAEETDSSKTHDGTMRGQVELKDDSDRSDFFGSQASERDKRFASFKDHHVTVVMSHIVDKLEEFQRLREIFLHQFSAETDQETQGERRAKGTVLSLTDEAENRNTVTLAKLVEESESVVLDFVALGLEDLANFRTPAFDHVRRLVRELDTSGDGRASDILVLVQEGLLDVAFHRSNDASITDFAESADSVRLEDIVVG